MHKLLFNCFTVLSICLILSCSGSSKVSKPEYAKPIFYKELMGFYDGCRTHQCIEDKFKQYGFKFKEGIIRSSGKTYTYQRTFELFDKSWTQIATYMEKGGLPYIGFSTPAALNDFLMENIKTTAKLDGFTLHENSDQYIIRKNNTFIAMKDAKNNMGIRMFTFFIY
jgi:hypothetical protein